ncbi:MAG: protease complex subunit PrcB family protein [bacterium]
MKDLLIIVGMIIASGIIGAYLYFYTPDELMMGVPAVEQVATTTPNSTEAMEIGGPVDFTTLTTGTHAGGVTTRKNYLATDAEGIAKLWKLAFGTSSTTPAVDLSSQEVVGVFAGQKPTGGYAIAVTKVEDSATERTVYVTLTVPGKGCMVTQSLSTPYSIIVMPRSPLPVTHQDATSTRECE